MLGLITGKIKMKIQIIGTEYINAAENGTTRLLNMN
jgi:hypothetical protein